MNPPRIPAIGLWAVFATAVVSLFGLSYRYKMEAKNKRVGLCVEMQAVKDAAATSLQRIARESQLDLKDPTDATKAKSLAITNALLTLKEEGVSHIAISEDHVADLLPFGLIRIENGILRAQPGDVYKRLRFGIEDRFKLTPTVNDRDKGIWGPIDVPMQTLSTVSLGLNPEDAKLVKDAGLQLIARLGNAPATDVQYVGQKLTDAQELGASIYLPEGDSVLGQRFLVEDVGEIMEGMNMQYAAPEFAKLSGDALLAKLNLPRLVRVHSIQAAEIERMSPNEAIERWVRAFSERNIRILLLRPLSSTIKPDNDARAIDNLTSVVSAVKAGITKEGGGVGVPRPFEDPKVPQSLFFAIGICAALVTIIAFTVLVSNQVLQALFAIGLVALGLACYLPEIRPFMALIAAMSFPICAYLYLGGVENVSPLRNYLVMSLISVTGGLVVAALLNTLPYFVRVEQFLGVKLAHFGPILIIAVIVTNWTMHFAKMMSESVRWLSLIVALVVLAAVGLMLMRTGNDNPAAVSGIELRFRALLDAVLQVRPRTKEFLLGNPALILGLFLWASQALRPKSIEDGPIAPKGAPSPIAALLLVVGAIGQTSIVNTLCHLHTPLMLSLMRIGMGIIAGGIVGSILWLLFRPRPTNRVPVEA